MKYAIVTFGCRVNQADALMLETEFRARSAAPAPPEDADVVIVNTCSVTAAADQGARQAIRRIVRNNPSVRVIVTGCYATRQPAELQHLPNVTHVVTNADKDRLLDVVGAELGLPARDVATAREADAVGQSGKFADGEGPCGAALSPGAAGRTAFTMRVQTGCEERCSYCIIPTTRGPARSKPPDVVLDDIRRAVSAGYKEIVITGVHLGSYGRDVPQRTSLTALVRQLAEWPDDVLFRISSLEPMDCSPEIVDAVAGSPRIAPHFHLPLQHGSDEILRAMRRPYTSADYRRLVESIHRRMPDASIGSDIIVGFPGESSAHFDEMSRMLHELPLSHLHVFPYSDRPGTAASALPGKLDGVTIRARGAEVRAIGREMSEAFRRSQHGTKRRALTVDDGMSAVTDNYLKVRLTERHTRNQWVTVVV